MTWGVVFGRVTAMNTTPPPLAVVVLAAGKGTRMKSDLNKVLHPLAGQPMVAHVLAATGKLSPVKTVVITGHQAADVEAAVRRADPEACFAFQAEQKGTGHAVQMAQQALHDFDGDVLIVCGDVPLVRTEALAELIDAHRAHGVAVSVGSAVVENPFGLGRIIRDDAGAFVAIREQKDCTEGETAIREGNTGLYVVDAQPLWALLDAVKPHNAQGEYYLTDIVANGIATGHKVEAHPMAQDAHELLGVNTPEQLAEAERLFLQRKG